MNTRIRTCYIAAPAGAKLEVLRNVLETKGISVVVPEEAPVGSYWPTELSSILSTVDLVIGILTRERRSEWVLFELGQAWANNRQILLFTPPKGSLVPSDLQRFLVIRANLGNREAIDFAVDQILAAPSPVKGSDDAERRDYHGLGPSADVFLREARAAIGAGEGLRLEEIVARALRQSGVDVIAEHPGADRGVDLAIWSDPLQPLLGNPILIEIKSRIRTKDEARSALQHLSSAIASSGTQWGLLLYGEGPPNEGKLWTSAPPNVLVLSLATLFDRMRRQPFSEIMKTLRNRRVHGGYP